MQRMQCGGLRIAVTVGAALRSIGCAPSVSDYRTPGRFALARSAEQWSEIGTEQWL